MKNDCIGDGLFRHLYIIYLIHQIDPKMRTKITQSILYIALISMSISLKAEPPNWTVNPSDYQFNMIGILRVLNMNNTFYNNPGTVIRSLVGSETRGVVQSDDIIFIGDEAYMPITIFSNEQEGELLTFEIYAPSTDSIYIANETSIFNRFESLGTAASPFILNIPLCIDILTLSADNQPFRSFYKAEQEIHLLGFIPNMSEVLLGAPIVRILDGTEISTPSDITISATGCVD